MQIERELASAPRHCAVSDDLMRSTTHEVISATYGPCIGDFSGGNHVDSLYRPEVPDVTVSFEGDSFTDLSSWNSRNKGGMRCVVRFLLQQEDICEKHSCS